MSSVYGQTLLDDMVQRQGLPMYLVKEAAKEILVVIREGLIQDGVVNVSHFGIFRLKSVAARQGYNPQTKAHITIPAHQRVIFSPCKALRELIQPVHHPVVPINEPKAPRAAAKNAAIATPIATKRIVIHKEPTTSTSQGNDAPDKSSLPVEPAIEELILTSPRLPPVLSDSDDKTVQTPSASETATKTVEPPTGNNKYYYLGATAAAIIALVSVSVLLDRDDKAVDIPVASIPVAPEIPPVITPAEIEDFTAGKESIVATPEAVTTLTSPPHESVITKSIEDAPELFTAHPPQPAPIVEREVTIEENIFSSEITTELPVASLTPEFFFSERTHEVSRGESLWRLAKKYYQDPLLWPHIYQANAAIIKNPDYLRMGKVIVLPSLQGSPEKLTKSDRRNIAEGYYLTYLYYKESGHQDAFFALLEAKRYDSQVVEEHRSLLQLSKVEEVLLKQQKMMPF